MMRWLAGWCGMVLAVCLLTGCGSRCFLDKETFDQAHSSLLPQSMEKDYTLGQQGPLTEIGAAPPTVYSPDRPPRYLSLQEAIALALENGTASGRGGIGTGIYDTNLVSSPPTNGASTSPLTSQTDNLRVLSLQPAIAGADIEASLARFDTSWISLINWTSTDNLIQGLNSFNNGSSATGSTSFVKELASGGFVSTTFQQNYQLLTSPPTGGFNVLNPLYSTSLILGFEQPLWRNRGVRINQLLSGTSSPTTGIGVPGQVANQFGSRQASGLQAAQIVSSDGILIARLRFDQSRAEFERVVQGLILQVEVAYWNLYNAYGQLYGFEESLRIAHRAWMIAHSQVQVGTATDVEYQPVLGQYEEFRGQRFNALGAVIIAEQNLRGLLGRSVEDGTRLVPVTAPTLAHFQPSWEESCHDALTLRPELVLARDNLRLAQYNLEVAENFLKPDVRFGAQYTPLGFGTTLAGNGTFTDATGGQQPSNALRSLASSHFANWQVGLTANVPIGLRLEHAGMRIARISVAQNYYLVKDQEQKAKSYLAQQYAEMQKWYKLIETRQTERKAYARAVDAQYKKVLAGKKLFDVTFLDFQAKLADSQVKEYQAISEYNNTLAKFEFAKGTILKFNNVHIAEGQLPQCVQVRATEHEKEQSRAIVLHERPDPLTHPGRLASTENVPYRETPEPLPIFNRLPPVDVPAEQGEKLDVLPEKAGATLTPGVFKAPALTGPIAMPVENVAVPSSVPTMPMLPAEPVIQSPQFIPTMPVVPADPILNGPAPATPGAIQLPALSPSGSSISPAPAVQTPSVLPAAPNDPR